MAQHAVTERKRAPSQRSIDTRNRILDAAERVFSDRGFEGASIRDIATEAGVQKASVNFHGGSKEELFERIVARRADILTRERLDALQKLERNPDWQIDDLIACFVTPLLTRAFSDPQWLCYARLVAIVSSDRRWGDLADRYFDPAADAFVTQLLARNPSASQPRVAAAFVYTVSSMLALCTSQWRIRALSSGLPGDGEDHLIRHLIRFCSAGVGETLAQPVAGRD